jgi:hypothetical protein
MGNNRNTVVPSAVDFIDPAALFGTAVGTGPVLGPAGAMSAAPREHSSQPGGFSAPRQHSHHHHHHHPHQQHSQQPQPPQASMRTAVSADAHIVNSDTAILDDRWSAFMHGFSVIAAE